MSRELLNPPMTEEEFDAFRHHWNWHSDLTIGETEACRLFATIDNLLNRAEKAEAELAQMKDTKAATEEKT